MNELMKRYKCDRCKREFSSYMTYKEEDIKICGNANCFEIYQEEKKNTSRLIKDE